MDMGKSSRKSTSVTMSTWLRMGSQSQVKLKFCVSSTPCYMPRCIFDAASSHFNCGSGSAAPQEMREFRVGEASVCPSCLMELSADASTGQVGLNSHCPRKLLAPRTLAHTQCVQP